MSTGKIEYSPDYKPKKPKVGDVVGAAKVVYGGRLKPTPIEDDRTPEEIERTRLEREVIEKAKRDRLAIQQGHGSNADIDRAIQTRREFSAAVDALLAFEAEHK